MLSHYVMKGMISGTWSQERDPNISKTCVFIFHHSIQHDEASGYTFYTKSNNSENTSLIENGSLLTNDFEIAETFNKHFQNLVPNLDLKIPCKLLCQTLKNGDEILAAIYKY